VWRWVLCVVLVGCGPVLLGEEERAPAGSHAGEAGSGSSANGEGTRDASTDPGATGGAHSAAAQPVVVVHLTPLDCGRCFTLRAEGSGGTPPYVIEWGDGAQGAERKVCVDDSAGLALSVVARDAADARSAAQSIQLEATDGGCPLPTVPARPAPSAGLCLKNPSLEGTPAPNLGQDQAFDAAPWSACIDSASPPAMQPNTPDIGNESIAVTPVPPPTDGNTYLALGEGEQVSQALCGELQAGTAVSLALDLQSFDISGGAVPSTEQVFLEIWGGLAADCSQRERLWASPGLAMGWKRYCVTLQPTAYTTQLTLRATSDMSSLMPGYLFVDNLQPVASCP
jgi:hypothetical protein